MKSTAFLMCIMYKYYLVKELRTLDWSDEFIFIKEFSVVFKTVTRQAHSKQGQESKEYLCIETSGRWEC